MRHTTSLAKTNVKTSGMTACEVFVNGKRLCVAGIRDGYVSAYVTCRSQPQAVWIDVMGIDNRKKKYVRWAAANLCSGDEIVVKIVGRRSVDKCKTIRSVEEKRDFVALLKGMVRAEAMKLGRELQRNAPGDILRKLQSSPRLGTLK